MIYAEQHRYLSWEKAQIEFGESIEEDPVKLRIINSLAAMEGPNGHRLSA